MKYIQQTPNMARIASPRPYQLMGFIWPIGVTCLCCMSADEIAMAESRTQEFVPVHWNVPVGDGEIRCGDCGITVLQEA